MKNVLNKYFNNINFLILVIFILTMIFGVSLRALETTPNLVFHLRGNDIMATTDLTPLMLEQKDLVEGSDLVAQIKKKIIEYYQSHGFNQTEVTTLVSGRHVTYEIKEGMRSILSDVTFEGLNSFSYNTLKKQFNDLTSQPVKRDYFVFQDIRHTMDLLLQWVKSQGFLSAQLKAVTVSSPVDKNRYVVKAYFFEGPRTLIDSIEYVDQYKFTKEETNEILDIDLQKPLNIYNFNEGLEKLKQLYRDRGYFEAKILNENEEVIQYDQDQQLAHVRLKFDEGRISRIKAIQIHGLEYTDAIVLNRLMPFQEGDVLKDSDLKEVENEFKKLGIFSQVETVVSRDTQDASLKSIDFNVKESVPGFVAGGIGLRNDLGPRFFAQVGYHQLWRRLHSASLSLELNRRFDNQFCSHTADQKSSGKNHCFIEYQISPDYVWPWFLGVPELTFRPRLTLARYHYRALDANSTSMTATWSRPILKELHMNGFLTYGLERLSQYNSQNASDDMTLTIGSLTPGLSIDFRDQALAPTRGFFGVLTYEFASPFFFSQRKPIPVTYSRSQLRLDQFISLPLQSILYLSFRTGVEINHSYPAEGVVDPRYAIPLSKQFTLGGVGSLRGFKEQSLNLYNYAIQGYASYVNYRLQIDFPFSGQMKVGPFLDAANLNLDRYVLGSLRVGSGFGIHYHSPIGAINFDVGFNVKPRALEDKYQFHFSVGTP